jgi:pantoate--beta-alanine ligase
VTVVGVPTVREPDGLALSSRNALLSPADRVRAAALYRGLQAAKALYGAGERRPGVLVAAARVEIAPHAGSIDYIEVCDAETLAPPDAAVDCERPLIVLVAATVGGTRLIDNMRL